MCMGGEGGGCVPVCVWGGRIYDGGRLFGGYIACVWEVVYSACVSVCVCVCVCVVLCTVHCRGRGGVAYSTLAISLFVKGGVVHCLCVWGGVKELCTVHCLCVCVSWGVVVNWPVWYCVVVYSCV